MRTAIFRLQTLWRPLFCDQHVWCAWALVAWLTPRSAGFTKALKNQERLARRKNMELHGRTKIHQDPSRSIHAFYILCSFVLRLRTSSAMAPSPFQLWNFSLSSNSRKIERERHRETEHSKTERRRSKSNDNHARIVFWNLSIKHDQMKPCTTRHNISTLW